jgi:SAM-dependent methyltransferase
MIQFFKNHLKKIINVLPPKIACKLEFKRQKFDGYNERAIEFGFVFKSLGRIYPRKVLDVGTGETALPRLIKNCGFDVTAIDNITDYWSSGMTNRYYHILDKDITAANVDLGDTFDLVSCISVLEHINDYNSAVNNMLRLLSSNGHLVLTMPYTENTYVEDVYRLPDSNAYQKTIPFVCQSYSRNNINEWLENNNAVVVEQEYWRFWQGEFWSTGKQIIPPLKVASNERHQLTCLLIKKLS